MAQHATRGRPSLLCLYVFTIGLAGCGSWEKTRDEMVIPVNELVHRRYPAALREMVVDHVVELYGVDARQQARKDVEALLAGFENVVNADCKIESVAVVDDELVSVPIELRVEGLTEAGAKRALIQRGTFTCRKTESGWIFEEWIPREVRTWNPSGPRYLEQSTERGLVDRHKSRGVLDHSGELREYLAGSGLSVRDIDHNGFEDVLLVSGGDLRLYTNRSGSFTDETRRYGLTPPPEGECRFGVFGDIDNDGDPELFVGVVEGPNYLYRLKDGRFEGSAADDAGITSSLQATSASFFDYDNDGHLDIYIANGANLLREIPEPIHNAKNGTPNQLFRNKGDGTFEDVTDETGVDDSGWALGCVVSDYDRDGDLDIFVANDFSYDVLYQNQGDGTFDDVTDDAGIIYRGSSMGCDFGDLNGDGLVDLFLSGMESQSRWIIDQPNFPVPAPWPLSFIFKAQVLEVMGIMLHGNRLYMSRGDGYFEEVSIATRTDCSGWAWGGIFFDYDNDTDQDIYVLNGFRSGKVKDDL